MKRTAVGCHVFAGGFTVGVQKVMNVDTHLEVHGFGLETARALCGVETINRPDYRDWPKIDGRDCMIFGNPRCTAFSCITSGYGESSHGQWAGQTRDIHELCDYATKNEFSVVCWESVQQAYTKGQDLIKYLIEQHFDGYRVAHILLSASSFGNPQFRKRYFFMAYRDHLKFNIEPPDLPSPYETTLYDGIYHMRDRPTTKRRVWTGDYDYDSYTDLTADEWQCVPHLPNGWCLNSMARYAYDKLPTKFQECWDMRSSGLPFSMHGIFRTNWMRPAPTLHSSAGRFIHPDHDRPLTVGEIATVMGWPDGKMPIGKQPVAQIAKGIVPAAGEWLARQAELALSGHWGEDDWESRYDPIAAEWVGGDATGEREKVFDLTKYVGSVFDVERFDLRCVQSHLHNIDPKTGRPVKPWNVTRL